jgi:hypothetical protein
VIMSSAEIGVCPFYDPKTLTCEITRQRCFHFRVYKYCVLYMLNGEGVCPGM